MGNEEIVITNGYRKAIEYFIAQLLMLVFSGVVSAISTLTFFATYSVVNIIVTILILVVLIISYICAVDEKGEDQVITHQEMG